MRANQKLEIKPWTKAAKDGGEASNGVTKDVLKKSTCQFLISELDELAIMHWT